MKKTYLIPLLTLLFSVSVFANSEPQKSITIKCGNEDIDSLPKRERLFVSAGTHAALWIGSFVALNQAWYKDYPKSSFHFFNDNSEWKQMDKAGHVWTTYQLARLSAASWKWAGLDARRSNLYGAASAVAFQSIIEIQDGFSEQWGFSWGDMAANIAGGGLMVLQQEAWQEQRIAIKLTYNPTSYGPQLVERRNQVFGKTLPERILKDYNSQTYWISANIRSFVEDDLIPGWLNLAVGYGTKGVLGARSNKWTDKEGNNVNRSDIRRVRQFYLSPDIDFTRIKTNSKFLRSLLFVLNAVKIPAPALELNSRGNLQFHIIQL